MDDNHFGESRQSSAAQLFRYTIVGLVTNCVGYMIYLIMTYLGATPKLTMTLLYGIGATIGFFGNRNFTFEHTGSQLSSGFRYLIAHLIGYLINLSLLFFFVDQLGYKHQWVQAVAIFVVALYLFIAFKYFTFAELKTSSRQDE